MTTLLLEERKRLFADRLHAIARLAERLAWSHDRVGFPLDARSLGEMDEQRAESLSAFIERFAKLQDLLGASFREVVALSGQPAEDFNLVLSAMEKAGIVSADSWRELRAQRNRAAHEYSLSFERPALIFNALGAATAHLFTTATALSMYCGETLGIVPTARHHE
jgi:hypothetical protein